MLAYVAVCLPQKVIRKQSTSLYSNSWGTIPIYYLIEEKVLKDSLYCWHIKGKKF